MEQARALTPFQREETTRQEADFLRTIRDAGVTINTLTTEEINSFSRQLRHIPLQFEETIGSNLLSKTDELLHAWKNAIQKEEEILVGLDADLSQAGWAAGLSIKRGALMAMKEINDRGGVLGKPMRLLARDNMAIPSRGEENFRHFAGNPNLVAILGGMHSTVTTQQANLADTIQIPLLIPWAAAAGVVERNQIPHRFTFRVSANDRLAGPFLVDAALERGKRVALILENTSWGRGILPSMQHRFQEHDQEPVLVDWVNRGEQEWSLHLDAFRNAQSDVALLVLNVNETAQWLQQLSTLPKLPAVVSHWGLTGGTFAEKTRTIRDRLDLAFLQTFSLLKVTTNQRKTLYQTHQALFDTDLQQSTLPQTGMAHAYDLIHMLASAIKNAGSMDRNAIRDALEQLPKHEGLLKTYAPPFQSTRHDALDRNDFFLARYTAEGQILPLDRQRATP